MSSDAASIASRLAAMLYELLLVFAILAVGFAFPHVLIGLFAHRAASPGILWGHVFVLLFLYFGWFWLHGGQTLAMRTWRIRLVSTTDATVPLWQAVLRYLLAWPSIGIGGIGLLWALFDTDGQFLHDRLAGTRLIRTAST